MTHHKQLAALALPSSIHDPAVRRVVHNLWLEEAERLDAAKGPALRRHCALSISFLCTSVTCTFCMLTFTLAPELRKQGNAAALLPPYIISSKLGSRCLVAH